MTYDDIEKDLASWRDFLRFIKKDVSSGQIRNYGNVLNGLKRLAGPILSLRNEQKDETILEPVLILKTHERNCRILFRIRKMNLPVGLKSQTVLTI